VQIDIDVDSLRLKAALRDFVALSAIPAVSVGREPEAVAAGLADSLVEVLQLEFAFVRMSDPGGVAAIEVTRGSTRTNVRESLESQVSPISSGASHEVVLDVGDDSRPCHGIAIPIGVSGKGGLVVAASKRSDFPSAIDRVLLSLAANHAAIAFENARLIHERDRAEAGLRKARDELEARVFERTAELNVANEELSALRRVATLVAEAAAPSAVLDAVAGEMQALLDADQVALNRFEPGAEIVVLAHRGLDVNRTPVGSRVSHEGENVTSIVRRTGRPGRMENYEEAGGALAELARATGLRSSVSAPITVEGQVWGVITASWKSEGSPPANTEDRMAKFAHLIDTAIANSEARAEIEQLAQEQAALRRVATLVAQEVPQAEVFSAIAEEVGRLLRFEEIRIVRYYDDRAVVVGGLGWTNEVFPLGAAVRLDDDSAASRVFRTGRSVRIDDYATLSGPVAESARSTGVHSVVATPISVGGRVWGAITAGVVEAETLPRDTEFRLAQFTELIATAISNAEARVEVERLVDEQAALRRVATLVAQGVAPAEVFNAVSKEVERVFAMHETLDVATVVRFDPGPACVLVGMAKPFEGLPLGSRWAPKETFVSTKVLRTGRSARVEKPDLLSAPDEDAEMLRRLTSQVGSPIIVEGRLWGAVTMNANETLPADTEERLAKFTGLVAAAISNAESRQAVAQLADEQAALRRVAVLVARESSPVEVFGAVTQEAARVVETEAVGMLRFESDGTATLVAQSDTPWDPPPLGTKFTLDGENVITEVLRTGRAARADDWTHASGSVAAMASVLGVRSSVATPIVVEGRLWGTMVAVTSQSEPLRADTESRIAQFTELVATAIANAGARAEVERLAEEQAALRRVATLVARGAAPQELFSAAVEEVGQLLPVGSAAMGRFESDDSITTIAAWSASEVAFVPGRRWTTEGKNVTGIVQRTGRSARLDDFSDASGPIGVQAREAGYRSVVGTPIMVGGRLWGVMTAASTHGLLPPETEARLASFTELLATAIANAESRESLERLADEQAALRRVATLVARDAPSTEVVEAVATEAGKLLADDALVCRYDGDGAATVIGSWRATGGAVPVGTRSAIGGKNALTMVAETGRPARLDSYGDATGEIAEIARRYGWRSAIAAPIVVEDRLWGVMLATTEQPEPFPDSAEERLAAFTELVATAVANTQAREQVRALVEEQAALRRVATLVAQGVRPSEIFSAVSDEVGRLFGSDQASVTKFDSEGPSIVIVGVAQAIDAVVSLGTRWELHDSMASAHVFRTGRSARIDRTEEAPLGGPAADTIERLDLHSTVASPIVVEGRLWGTITVSSSSEPLLGGAEQRLEKFTELVATAISNAESRSELAASRRRIVAASDEARRQFERDLHDSTQQRLVSLGLLARAAEASAPTDRDDLRDQLGRIALGLTDAVEELQVISRGIHPAILSQGGLAPALRALARRSAIPVELDVATEARLSEPIEVAAYFVVSEALANAAKHSHASRVDVSLASSDGGVNVSVRDDGVGGATLGRGSGLVGLLDRVEALGGTLAIDSEPGGGTLLVASLPLAEALT
jgi:GAF domain-containing protein